MQDQLDEAPDHNGGSWKGLGRDRLRLSGEGAVMYVDTGSNGAFPNSEFRIDEARLFLDAKILDTVFVFAELMLAQRETDDLEATLGELYLDVEDLWPSRPGLLNLRAGRVDIPFGEEYLTRDSIDNPLVSHFLPDLWGIDEGLELYGRASRFDYVVAVQNGGHDGRRDFDSDKSITGRAGYNHGEHLRVSLSAMRTGDLHAEDDRFSELWFGNGFIRAVGEFIAGVAHELNNPLTVMVGFTQLLKASDLEEEYKKDIRQIAESSDRCHKIVQNLLSFARQRPPEQSRVNVHELLGGTAQFLGCELRTSNIEVVKQCRAEVPHVDADPYQVQQVFLNIMNNARQAMEEAEIRGHIILRTVTDADRIRIEIQDNGPGIPAENIDKLFDPFFTTKELGKGTGLGLSVSYGIIKEHGGSIEVASSPGEGTSFRIDLPVSAGVQPDRRLTEIAADALDDCIETKKSVLVVDDEASILGLTSRILESWGYDVETASDGQEGLERTEHRSFDLVLCDTGRCRASTARSSSCV